MREVCTGKAITIAVILEDYCSGHYQGGISHDRKGFSDIRDQEYWGHGEDGLEFVEGSLLESCPVPWLSFSGEEVQGSDHIRESKNEFPIEIGESSK